MSKRQILLTATEAVNCQILNKYKQMIRTTCDYLYLKYLKNEQSTKYYANFILAFVSQIFLGKKIILSGPF